MPIGTKTVWKCSRCGHEWLSENNKEPLRCGKCKTPYWNVKQKEKSVKQ